MQPEGGKSKMSHPGNTPKAFTGEDGSPEKHRSDSLTTGKTGQLVEVYHKCGSVSRGQLQHGADGIVLEMPFAYLKRVTGEIERIPPIKTVFVPTDEILEVVYVEKHRWLMGGGDLLPEFVDAVFSTRGLDTRNLYGAKIIPSVQDYEPRDLGNLEIEQMTLEARQFTNVANDVPLDIPTHRYGPGSFDIHGLPNLYLGTVVGLLGGKSTGKTTCLKILAGQLKPNLGRFEDPPEWDEIIDHFDTEHIRTYLTRLQTNTLNVALKSQDLTVYRSSLTVRTSLEESKGTGFDSMEELIEDLDMTSMLDTCVTDLSDAELQRFAIASTIVQMADVYLFDEPTIFLDARQKYQVARVILSVVKPDRYVCITDNDMSVLDLVCDHILYTGEETTSGEVHLDHYPLTLEEISEEIVTPPTYRYPETVVKGFGTFSLHVMGGDLRSSEITVVLGNMHTGKTLFLEWLNRISVGQDFSHKDQKMIKCENRHDTVATHLYRLIRFSSLDRVFQELVLKPLGIVKILDKRIKEVSQSTLQKIAIATCLGQEGARVFLLDEPSIHLDARERVIAAQTIKRFIAYSRKAALVVEQDFMMATYLADRVIVVQGEPGVQSTVNSPVLMSNGVNQYLSDLNITCRTNRFTSLARMNKPRSVEDEEQKTGGHFFEDLGRPVKNLGRVED
ncbi:PREDICTED: ABC transporter E family member 2-like isoform X2 [Brassica oleracea var. oleracea]|uniref:ABC transporter E family member 2-like isoform X2 n=1 Tax=Brassica oleracea var. oleracea TaxID=109376 RepID=UPI0006A72A7E|nr:PREDICTED: ABC transporter E family member 2-like isoform X2 [Brassica oleracea var. oleracea]